MWSWHVGVSCQMLKADVQDVCCVQTSPHSHCCGVFCLLQLYIQQGEKSSHCWNVSTLRLQDHPWCGGRFRALLLWILALKDVCVKHLCFYFRLRQRLTSHPVRNLYLFYYQENKACLLRLDCPVADVKTRKEKLEQVASFSLFGNVMSMASVQLIGGNREALLLSFKDAKVSLKNTCTALTNLSWFSLICVRVCSLTSCL